MIRAGEFRIDALLGYFLPSTSVSSHPHTARIGVVSAGTYAATQLSSCFWIASNSRFSTFSEYDFQSNTVNMNPRPTAMTK